MTSSSDRLPTCTAMAATSESDRGDHQQGDDAVAVPGPSVGRPLDASAELGRSRGRSGEPIQAVGEVRLGRVGYFLEQAGQSRVDLGSGAVQDPGDLGRAEALAVPEGDQDPVGDREPRQPGGDRGRGVGGDDGRAGLEPQRGPGQAVAEVGQFLTVATGEDLGDQLGGRVADHARGELGQGRSRSASSTNRLSQI